MPGPQRMLYKVWSEWNNETITTTNNKATTTETSADQFTFEHQGNASPQSVACLFRSSKFIFRVTVRLLVSPNIFHPLINNDLAPHFPDTLEKWKENIILQGMASFCSVRLLRINMAQETQVWPTTALYIKFGWNKLPWFVCISLSVAISTS